MWNWETGQNSTIWMECGHRQHCSTDTSDVEGWNLNWSNWSEIWTIEPEQWKLLWFHENDMRMWVVCMFHFSFCCIFFLSVVAFICKHLRFQVQSYILFCPFRRLFMDRFDLKLVGWWVRNAITELHILSRNKRCDSDHMLDYSIFRSRALVDHKLYWVISEINCLSNYTQVAIRIESFEKSCIAWNSQPNNRFQNPDIHTIDLRAKLGPLLGIHSLLLEYMKIGWRKSTANSWFQKWNYDGDLLQILCTACARYKLNLETKPG